MTDNMISVIGLGYVGLPVAVAFARAGRAVIGFDASARRIEELRRGIDRTRNFDRSDFPVSGLSLTASAQDIGAATFHIVAVPTPIDGARRPDLSLLERACRTVAPLLKKGDIVVFESTVYPGCTEEICIPILEAGSKLRSGSDFGIGYSPERINPGDTEHTFTKILKIVAGDTPQTLERVAAIYGSVVEAGVYRASSIKVAEAAKVIENTQRDLNIALINELAIVFKLLDLDTRDVLAAAGTKWNFLKFRPGLVGGHCIGVDPYYLTHRAEMAGYDSQVILAGRQVNDSMGRFVAQHVIKGCARAGISLSPRVTVLGLTFKENIADVRNSKVVDLISELRDFGAEVQVCDPHAFADEVAEDYGLSLTRVEDIKPADAVVLAVPHDEFRHGGWPLVVRALRSDGRPRFVADLHDTLDRAQTPNGVVLWRL
jgi:UDP-N-acetyl-D-galactosamine dehydrogenase